MSHSAPHEKIRSTEQDYHRVLDFLWADGARHFVMVDEVVGGTQIVTDLQSTGRWLERRHISGASLTVFCVQGADSDVEASKLERKCRRALSDVSKRAEIDLVRSIRAERLLEKDRPGLLFRAYEFDHPTATYRICREQPKELWYKCPTTEVLDSLGSLTSADGTFGGIIRRIIGWTDVLVYSP